MSATNCFIVSWVWGSPTREEIYVWFCKSSVELIVGKLTNSRNESITIVMLKEHSIKLLSKFIIYAALRSHQRFCIFFFLYLYFFTLYNEKWLSQELTNGQRAENKYRWSGQPATDGMSMSLPWRIGDHHKKGSKLSGRIIWKRDFWIWQDHCPMNSEHLGIDLDEIRLVSILTKTRKGLLRSHP